MVFPPISDSLTSSKSKVSVPVGPTRILLPIDMPDLEIKPFALSFALATQVHPLQMEQWGCSGNGMSRPTHAKFMSVLGD